MLRSMKARRVSVAVCLGLVAAACCPALGQTDFYWNDPMGGPFGDPGNWLPAAPPGPPGPNDTAIFEVPAYDPVVFDGSYANDRLVVNDPDVLFDLAGNTYSLTHVMDAQGSVEIGSDPGGSANAGLTVTGGSVASAELWMGRDADDTGELVVGAGADWSTHTFAHFTVAQQGSAQLLVRDGGSFEFDYGIVAFGAGSTGMVEVSGGGSLFRTTSTGRLNLGLAGGGFLIIEEGASAQNQLCRMGAESGGSGWATVTGGSVWDVLGLVDEPTLEVGYADGASGTVTVVNGGRLTNAGELTLACTEGSSAAMTVTGFGSTVEVGGMTVVGSRGSGTLSLQGGGALASQLDCHIGFHGVPESVGAVIVSGVGSTMTVATNTFVGFSGAGSLSIAGGAYASSAWDGYIGHYPEASGSAAVDGFGSRWDIGFDCYVGGNSGGEGGPADLAVSNQGAVTVGNHMQVFSQGAVSIHSGGFLSAWRATVDSPTGVVVSGAGSGLDLGCAGPEASLVVGEFGWGGAAVLDGAAATTGGDVVVGDQAGSGGFVSVSGNGSALYAGGFLTVGNAGEGGLFVTDGGTMTAVNGGSIGAQGGSDGWIDVQGAGSSLSFTSQVQVGDMGEGELCVYDGGHVSISGPVGHCFIGHSPGSAGMVEVEGTHSWLDVDGMLYVGGHGSGVPGGEALLFVDNGGGVDAGLLRVFQQGSVDLLDGWIETDACQIDPGAGFFIGEGALEVEGGLDNAGTLYLATPLASVYSEYGVYNTGLIAGGGRIHCSLANDPGGELAVPAGRTLLVLGSVSNAGLVTLTGGTLRADDLLNLPGGLILGNGTLWCEGGLINAGDAAFSGGANLRGDVDNTAGGVVIVSGIGPTTFLDDVRNDGEIRVSDGSAAVYFGDVTGTGTFTGTGTHYFEGDLKPGDSPGAVLFEGSVVFGPAAGLDVEIAGTAPGSEYDQVNVLGSAALSGTLGMELLGGFVPDYGDAFTVLTYGSRTGEFANEPVWRLGDRAVVGVYGPADLTLLATYPGDATLDVQVGYLDLGIVATNYNKSGRWASGDFTGDGLINYLDVGILATNYGNEAGGGGSVPEPATLVLLGAGIAALIRRR